MSKRKEPKPKSILGLDLKRTVRTALYESYGFFPRYLQDIHIETRSADGSYIRFSVGGHRYYILDGKVHTNDPV